MPDITMCSAKSCLKSKDCYRHMDSGTVPDEYWQAWCDFSNIEFAPDSEFDGTRCKYFVRRE